MRVLHMTLYKVYFDEIAKGEKKREFRRMTEYWQKRLEGKEYDVIVFKNGYRADAPLMTIEYLGLDIAEIGYSNGEKEIVYALKLGEVLEIKNYVEVQQSNSKENHIAY